MSDTRFSRRRRRPKNTEWRGDVLHARVRIRGTLHRWSLGLRHPLGEGDLEAARQRVAEGVERLRREAYGGTSRIRYDDMLASWGERHILHEVGAKTAKRYASSLVQLDPFLCELFMDEIDRAKVGEIVKVRRADGASNATIRRDLTALRSVCQFASDEQAADACLHWHRQLRERRDPIVLPDQAHVARVLKRCPAGPAGLAKLAAAALATGCRQDELVKAERGRLDHARKQLTVIGKGNKLRVIDLDYGGAYELLAGLPPAVGCRWLFWHPEPLRDGTGRPVKGQHTAQRYRNVSSRFSAIVRAEMSAAQEAARKAGHKEPDFRPFRFHDLRHAFAVGWLKDGRSIYDLQQRLGHRSIKTTEIYLEYLTPEERRVVMFGPQQAQPQPSNVRPLKPGSAS